MEEKEIEYIPLTEENFKEYFPYDGMEMGEAIKKYILEDDAYIRIDLKKKTLILTNKEENKNLIIFIMVSGKPMTILLEYLRSVFYENKLYIPRLSKKLIDSIDMHHMENITIKNHHTGMNFQSTIVKDVEAQTLFEEIKPFLKFSIDEIKLNSNRIKYFSNLYKDLIIFGTLTMQTITARRNKETQKKVVKMIIDYLIENIDIQNLFLINEEEANVIKIKLILMERKYEKDKQIIDNYFINHENILNLLLYYNLLHDRFNGNLKTVFKSTLADRYIIKTNIKLKEYVSLAYNAKIMGIHIAQNQYTIHKNDLNTGDLIKLILLSISGYISLKDFFIIDFDIQSPNEILEMLFDVRRIERYNTEFKLIVDFIINNYTLPYEDLLGKKEALYYNYFLSLKETFLLEQEFFQLQNINKENYIKYEECKLKIQLQNF